MKMKRYIGILALTLCLTACSGTPTPNGSAQGSDPVQSNPARPADSATVLDELPEGFVQVQAIGWCDFNRDGSEEEYKVSIREGTDYPYTYTLSIGGIETTGNMETPEELPYLVSLDGETVQLVLLDNGPSDDPVCRVFGWDGDNIFEAGVIEARPDEMTLLNGDIVAPVRIDVLQTSFFPLIYRLEGQTIVRDEDPSRWYSYAGGIGELKTLAELPLFSKDDVAAPSTLTVPAGTAVTVTGAALDREIENPSEGDDPLYWVRVEVDETGETGYLLANAYQCRLPGVGMADPASLFDGLIFAG